MFCKMGTFVRLGRLSTLGGDVNAELHLDTRNAYMGIVCVYHIYILMLMVGVDLVISRH